MQICFFEDQSAARFQPLTLTRPVDDLRMGILTIGEKWRQVLQPDTWSRITRTELKGILPQPTLDESQPCIWINSRVLPSDSFAKLIKELEVNHFIENDDTLIAACTEPAVTKEFAKKGAPDTRPLKKSKCRSEIQCISNLWDLYLMNRQEISVDISRIGIPPISSNRLSPQVILQNKKQLYIGKGAVIEPGATLIAREGPIFIGEGAVIQAGSIIRGPAAIGRGSIVKMSAKICKGSTIGPVCKVNGEINNSIIHSYSNKAHEGYLGNSLIGQWCNLGADTNTSNLKNNYGNIRITEWQTREKIDTGQQFLGTVMGDHSKTAINTHLNTGTMCGVSCNIFSGDFPPTFIPSFSWVGTNNVQPYKIEKALQTMQKVMARRDVPFDDDYAKLMRYLFEER